MEKKTKVEKTPEEIRADARQRKRNQRVRDYAARDELRLANMDPVETRVRKIVAQIALEPRRPVVLRNQPPIPAETAEFDLRRSMRSESVFKSWKKLTRGSMTCRTATRYWQ